MSSNFLQRFKGKTTTMGKDGFIDVVKETGTSGGGNVIVQTNINFKPKAIDPPQPKLQRHQSTQVHTQQRIQQQKKPVAQIKPPKPSTKHPPQQQPSTATPKLQQASPFYVANPFRLDDNQPLQQYQSKPHTSKAIPSSSSKPIQKSEKQDKPIAPSQFKQTSNASSTRGKSWDGKKGNSKEWVRMGGLGANIGGDQWQEKKKKLEKMQEFAEQVKMSNNEKIKERRPGEEDQKKQKKQKNAREKALEYCKNIPKPPKRPPKKEQQQPVVEQSPPQPPQPQQLSELELYQRRHQQLQKLINKN